MRYLVCYDIANDKRLRKVARFVDGFGDRVQFSVFEAVISKPKLDALIAGLNEIIDQNEDTVFIYPLPADSEKDTISLGKPKYDIRPGNETVFIV